MEKKKSWDDIPSLEGLEMEWDYKTESSRNRRASPRLEMGAVAGLFGVEEIRIKIATATQTYTARLLDLNEGGLCLEMPVALELHVPVRVGFFLGQMKIVSKGQVRHVSRKGDRYATGVKLIDLDKDSAAYLRELHAAQVFRNPL
jgi:hypothetical protein